MKKYNPDTGKTDKPDNTVTTPLTTKSTASKLHQAIPVIAVLLVLLFVISKTPRGGGSLSQGKFDLASFARIPVSADGRVKPMDTVARNSLQVISGRSELQLKNHELPPNTRPEELRHGQLKLPATRWLIDVMARPEQADNYAVFRIDHPGVLSLIGVQDTTRKRFSFNEILVHRETITQQVQQASQVPSRKRNAFQKHLMELWSHLDLYMGLAGMRYPYIVPPDATHDQWRPFDEVVDHTKSTTITNESAAMFSSLLFHYQQSRADEFNQTVSNYIGLVAQHNAKTVSKTGFEVFFNQLSPFYLCVVLYVLIFILASFSFMMRANDQSQWAVTLGNAAFWITVLTFAIHTFGLGARVYLQGRPPVTNLYSSAVFIGWGAVLFALLMELPFKLSIGTLLSSIIGFATLIVAMNLAEGDTMQMMQAVLDSNFWLATHVVIVTAGYSATFLAGLIGVMYILLGTMTRMITPEMDRVLMRMVYGVICFALLLSFTGTVLGGIWADQSWGRFWGWDPKENGAVLIVLWNALILHARWGGMVRTRGIMVLAVFGNIITAWSWFGTNMLGVGLHSYGFMDSAVFWLAVFMMSQLGIMMAGLMPLALWKSFANHPDNDQIAKASTID